MPILIFHSYANATSATVLMQHVAHEHKIQISSERIEAKQQKLTEIFVEQKSRKGWIYWLFKFASKQTDWYSFNDKNIKYGTRWYVLVH